MHSRRHSDLPPEMPGAMKALPAPGLLRLVGLGLLMVGLFRGAPLDAQVVTGRVVSPDTVQVIAGAFIQVFDQADNRVVFGVTDAEGAYELTLGTEGGPFRLQVDAFGFARASLPLPPVRAEQTLTIPDIVLTPEPVILDGLDVQADQQRLRPGREWVRRNQQHGTGTFLAGAMIELDSPRYLSNYIADRTELWVGRSHQGESYLYNPRGFRRCVQVMVNRWPLGRSGYRSIDDIPARHIAAIEIYESMRDRPPDYWMEGSPDCGIIQVWLWNSW
jgi:hypothetical protein